MLSHLQGRVEPTDEARNFRRAQGVVGSKQRRKKMLKGIVLWAMGVPIFVIILLYLFIF